MILQTLIAFVTRFFQSLPRLLMSSRKSKAHPKRSYPYESWKIHFEKSSSNRISLMQLLLIILIWHGSLMASIILRLLQLKPTNAKVGEYWRIHRSVHLPFLGPLPVLASEVPFGLRDFSSTCLVVTHWHHFHCEQGMRTTLTLSLRFDPDLIWLVPSPLKLTHTSFWPIKLSMSMCGYADERHVTCLLQSCICFMNQAQLFLSRIF